MGRSRFIPYLVYISTVLSRAGRVAHTPMEWKIRAQYGIPGYGQPTMENLDRWVMAFEDATKPGGCNAHCGYDPIVEAKIVRQSTGEVLVDWKRCEQRKDEPMFQVME